MVGSDPRPERYEFLSDVQSLLQLVTVADGDHCIFVIDRLDEGIGG
jgi:hypothetical protein